MELLVWSLPALAVIALILSGRVSPVQAAALGTALAVAVAWLAAPQAIGVDDLLVALARGAWIGWTIVPYIFGGLVFWLAAGRADPKDASTHAVPFALADDARSRRQLLFTACFLIGPFAESATGFGVGMLGTIALIRPMGLPPLTMVGFALLSQTFIPWGAMGSGTIVSASYARFSPTTLGLISGLFVVALMCVWLPLFWRLAERAGVGATAGQRASEALWLGVALALLLAATAWLGPETALLACFGPLIVVRYLLDQRPDRARLTTAAQSVLPHLLLIGWLLLTRLIEPLTAWLTTTARVQPWSQAPGWSPLFHAGTWLLVAGIVTALLRGRRVALPRQFAESWRTGRTAMLSVLLFSMMAETLSGSGIAAAWASRLFDAFGVGTVLATPLLAGLFGVLTNSGTAGNSLFMSAQSALAAQAGLSLPAVIGLQHVSGTCLSLFSPVRMSMACAMATAPGRERAGYLMMAPFAVGGLLVLLLAALGILVWRP